MTARECTLEFTCFEDARQIDEFVAGLRSRRLPFKFAYVGPAAFTHDTLVRSQEYGLADKEASLIRTAFASAVVPALLNTHLLVIDIGAGNGLKGLLVLRILGESIRGLRYAALDYSGTLLGMAVHNVSAELPLVDASGYQVDFENQGIGEITDGLRHGGYQRCLLLLLGHTLGNPASRTQVLANISEGIEIRRPPPCGY